MNLSSPTDHGGAIQRIANQLLVDPLDLIDFSSSINPLGPPQAAKEILKNAAAWVTAYPDPACQNLRDAWSRQWNVTPQSLLPGNGSTELIFLIPRVFRPVRTAILGPTFSEYERAARLAGSSITHLSLDPAKGFCWQPTPADLSILGQSDLCFICNPNNPTGTVLDRRLLLDLAGRFPLTLFVVDEAFVDFLEDSAGVSLLEDACMRCSNLIVLRSFTKFYSIAGLRLGCAAASPERIRALEEYKEPWTVNALAQAVGENLLEQRTYARETRRCLGQERAWLNDALGAIPGLAPVPSSANYILVKIQNSGMTAQDVFQKLLTHRLVVRDASNFHGLDRSYFRVAVKLREHNGRLVEGLRVIFAAAPAPVRGVR